MAVSFAYSTFRGASVDGVHVARLTLPAPPTDDDSAALPVLVHFHGGFWKTDWGMHNIPSDELHAAFGDGGDVASWDVEYARVDQAEPATSLAGGGWPHTCLDALAALNALAELPHDTRSRLDLRRVYLCGHSAGGYLALWLACLSRLLPAERERIASSVTAIAGAEAGAAARGGVVSSLTVCGVVGLAPVTSLVACAAAGLSDFHDAAINFLWRLGPSASTALATQHLGAACPLSLWCTLAADPNAPAADARAPTAPVNAAATPVSTPAPPLRILLVHGLADTDVPPSLSLSMAAAVWSHSSPPPLWLQLLPEADHYAVVGLSGALAAGERDAVLASLGQPAMAGEPASSALAAKPWALVAAALRAFVTHDDGALSKLTCSDLEQAESLAKQAALPVCARHTVGAITTADCAFAQWAAAEPDSATCMARGLRRWLAWVGESPGEATREWLVARTPNGLGSPSQQ